MPFIDPYSFPFPKRIISLVPSQTELLFELGLENEVVGITKFCIYPNHWFRNKKRVGGTKTVDLEAIRNLNPDLIIANKEENVKDQIQALAIDFPVFVTDVNDLKEAISMIEETGQIAGKVEKSLELTAAIARRFDQIPDTVKLISTAYLIWKDPFMAAGGDCFINSMMKIAGFENVFCNKPRYPTLSLQDIIDARPEVILLSSEPFPFRQKHAEELANLLQIQTKNTYNPKIICVAGEMFSWYGSRLLHTPSYLQKLRNDL